MPIPVISLALKPLPLSGNGVAKKEIHSSFIVLKRLSRVFDADLLGLLLKYYSKSWSWRAGSVWICIELAGLSLSILILFKNRNIFDYLNGCM